jgi:hypothetical protein
MEYISGVSTTSLSEELFSLDESSSEELSKEVSVDVSSDTELSPTEELFPPSLQEAIAQDNVIAHNNNNAFDLFFIIFLP